jgi:hypothetical protein
MYFTALSFSVDTTAVPLDRDIEATIPHRTRANGDVEERVRRATETIPAGQRTATPSRPTCKAVAVGFESPPINCCSLTAGMSTWGVPEPGVGLSGGHKGCHGIRRTGQADNEFIVADLGEVAAAAANRAYE